METRIALYGLFIFLFIGCQHGASGQLRMTPENTAGVVGTSVVLHCQASVDAPPFGIVWYEYITSTTRTSIVYNGDITPGAPNSQLYSITGDSSLAQYHLNIELAFLNGGRYECYEQFSGLTGRSHVTVLQSDPVCSETIQADGIVEEVETITYTCEVAYNSSSIDWPPVMTWTGPDGTITDVNKLSTSGGTVTSSVDVTGASGLNGAVYSVRTHFEAYGRSLPANHATNVPTYGHSHSFNALLVHYSPRDIVIRPDGNIFNPGDQLICSAVGNPSVSYIWYNSTDKSTLADGAELTIREEMDGLTCGCEAYNTIRGTKHSVSKEISLTVNKGCNPSPGVIAGIVIAVILLFGLLVVSSLLLWRTRNTPCEDVLKRCKQESNQQQPIYLNSSQAVYETPNPSDMATQPSEYAELSFTYATVT